MSSEHSIGAMNQLADALDAAGFTPDDVTRLRQYKDLALIRQVVHEHAKIIQVMPVIDCDTSPLTLDGWKVEEHVKGGQLKWNAKEVLLYLSEWQKNNKSIEGNKLRKELESMPVCNANVLDYLLANPELIPEEWKGKALFFWGTIYRDYDSELCVRCLGWDGRKWFWSQCCLKNSFRSVHHPAVLRAS